MDVYIKPKRKVSLSNQSCIVINDVADVVAPKEILSKIKKVQLLYVDTSIKKKQNFLVSVTDIIEKIQKFDPSLTVNNVGEMDTWVQYLANKPHPKTFVKWLKIAFVALVLFIGSATAIMSFHTDGQIPQVFQRFHSLFFGEENSNPHIISIPYSIGLAVGIIVFYNHFFGKKLTDDPTPIEVEMELYDRDVTDAMVDALSQRQERMEQEDD